MLVRSIYCRADAHIQENCERILATLNASERFMLHGKTAPSRNKREQIFENAAKSMKDLNVKKVGTDGVLLGDTLLTMVW